MGCGKQRKGKDKPAQRQSSSNLEEDYGQRPKALVPRIHWREGGGSGREGQCGNETIPSITF